jgi:hypothetical protein
VDGASLMHPAGQLCDPLPAFQGAQHVSGGLASSVDEEHMPELGLVLPVPVCELLRHEVRRASEVET